MAKLGRWSAIAAALISGGALFAAFPPLDQWWAAPIGVALLAIATHGRRALAGAGLGLLAGLALMVPLLSWAGGYVGAVWLLLPLLQAGYIALLGALSAWVSPLTHRRPWLWPLATGVLWVSQEALRDRTPFGGFPWGRLAFSQADSPLVRLAAIGGAPLVTFGVATIGGLLAVTALTVVEHTRRPHDRVAPTTPDGDGGEPVDASVTGAARTRVAIPVGVALLAVGVPLGVPASAAPGGDVEPVTVAIVQGNVPRLGLDFNEQRRAVLTNHVTATIGLAADVAAGRRPQPDLVVWPENASDVDPVADPQASELISRAARAIGVPILVGGLREGPGDRLRNVGLVWQPDTGPGQMYVKRHPVPFAEYIPMRAVARAISSKVDLVRSDFLAGPVPGVLTVGPTTIGDVICFEVAYDEVVRDTVTGGARLLVVQTNNATFNPAEARQQLAMVRLRAVEHGRPALMASTVGVSGFVDPAGHVFDATGFNTQAVIVRAIRPAAGRTIATGLGVLPELVLVVIAAVLVGAATTRRITSRRTPR